MLLVAFGYRELNNRMPDAGTSFTWAARAFGPWVGWMAGWGLIVATILVLSNLAGVAVEFLFLLISQITGNAAIADLAFNPWINIAVCLLFMLGATYISYRDMQTTQKLQYVLVTFQVAVLLFFAIAAIVQAVNGNGFDFTPFSWDVVQPVRRHVVRRRRGRPVAVDLHLLGLGRHPHDERGDEGPRAHARSRRHPHGRHDRRRCTCCSPSR